MHTRLIQGSPLLLLRVRLESLGMRLTSNYRQDLDPSSLATPVVVEGRVSVWITASLLLLAMITYFMPNQICRVGGGLWFLFDSYALLLYRILLLVITCQYKAALWLWNNMHLEFARIHYIRLIPGSPSPFPFACRLESLGTRLIGG